MSTSTIAKEKTEELLGSGTLVSGDYFHEMFSFYYVVLSVDRGLVEYFTGYPHNFENVLASGKYLRTSIKEFVKKCSYGGTTKGYHVSYGGNSPKMVESLLDLRALRELFDFEKGIWIRVERVSDKKEFNCYCLVTRDTPRTSSFIESLAPMFVLDDNSNVIEAASDPWELDKPIPTEYIDPLNGTRIVLGIVNIDHSYKTASKSNRLRYYDNYDKCSRKEF